MHKELNLLYTASTLEQSLEVLSNQHIAVTFCEGRLPDGRYQDLLTVVLAEHPATRFVVVLSEKEWAEEHAARKFGASYALRCPLRPTDIELVLIQVVREGLERVGLVVEAT